MSTLIPGDQLPTVVLAIWVALTVVAFAAAAWLFSVLRNYELHGDEPWAERLALAERLARREIDLEEYRAKLALLQTGGRP